MAAMASLERRNGGRKGYRSRRHACMIFTSNASPGAGIQGVPVQSCSMNRSSLIDASWRLERFPLLFLVGGSIPIGGFPFHGLSGE